MTYPVAKVRYKRPGKGPPWKRKKKQYEVVKLYNPGDPPECEYCQVRVGKLWKKGTIAVPLHKGCTCRLTKPYWVSKAVYEGKKGPSTKKYGGEMKKAQVFDRIERSTIERKGGKEVKRREIVGQEVVELETVESPELTERKCGECGKPMNPVEWMLSPGICGECVKKKHREVTGQEVAAVEVIPSTEEKVEEEKEELEQQLEEVQETLEEKEEAVEEAAEEAEDEAGKGAVEEAEVALEVAEETVEEAVEAVEGAETRSEIDQAEEVVEEAEEAVQEVTAQLEATKWRLYHGFDCNSVTGFNNGTYLSGEYDNEDEAREAAKQHLSPYVGEWDNTDPDAYTVTTGFYDEVGNELSEEEYDSDNPNHSYSYQYVSVEPIYEPASVALKVVSDPGWQLYHGTGCSSSPAHAGCASEGDTGLRFMDLDEARREAESLVGGGGDWLGDNEYELKTGHFDKEGNPITEQEYSAGMAQTPDPGHYYMFDFVRLEPATEPPYVARKADGVDFLVGKDYPHVCQACKDAVDRAADFLKNFGPDTDDPEAPMMYAADHGWLCGGRECVNEPVTAQVAQEEGAAEAVEEAVEKVKEEFKETLEKVVDQVEQVVEKVVEEVEEITARRMTIGQEEAVPAEAEEAKEEVEEAEEALEEAEAAEEVAEEELAEAEEEVAEAETPVAEEAVEEAEEAVEEAEVEVEEAEEELEGVQPEASLEAEMEEVDEMIAARDARKAQHEEFFTQKHCDRCGGELTARIMSWFTNDTICLDCSVAEDAIKTKMRERGMDPAGYEGCGYIPDVSGAVVEAQEEALSDGASFAQVHGDIAGLSDETLARLVKEYTEAKEELEGKRDATPEVMGPAMLEMIPIFEQTLAMLNEEIEKRKEVETPFQATRRIAALDRSTKSEEAARIIADEFKRKKDEGKKVTPLRPGRPTRIKRSGARDDRLTE